ncbi:MAG: putative bifunctional diguanylate cyclase/phosphodiesterase [Chloroflexota bacterium]
MLSTKRAPGVALGVGAESDGEALPKHIVGRVAAALAATGSLVTFTTLALGVTGAAEPAAVAAVGGATAALAAVLWVLPWQRWPRGATLGLIPIGFALIAFRNYIGTDPFRYGLFFVFVFAWLGVGHPRGTSLWMLPLFAVAYLFPIFGSDHYPRSAAGSVVYTAVVCVAVGETCAWVAARLRRAQDTLARRRGEARFRSLVQHSSDVILVVDPDATIRYASPSVERVLGYRPEAVTGIKLTDLLHPDDAPRAAAFLVEAAGRPGAMTAAEWRLRHQQGAWRQIEAVGNNLLSDPNVCGLVLNTRDVSERRALEEQLAHQAFHDPLTNLANRALFRNRVEHALARAGRHDGCVAVLFLDLDNFKNVNDSLGHAAGDQLLLAVAERIRGEVRPGDTAARLGGDEFAILLEQARHIGDPAHVADRVIESLRAPIPLDGKDVFVGASVGIAVNDARDEQAEDLLRNADVAMYMAKSLGKGQYIIFEPSMHAVALERLALAADLRRAVERQEFTLRYQPIAVLETGRIAGVEALVRWQHPEHGLLAPDTFIPLAEETGLIVPIGRWVLQQACRQMAQWREALPPDRSLTMSVNLSARQLQQPGLVEEVGHVLRQTGLDPQDLTLEMTETTLMEDTEVTIPRLQALRSLGVRLAIDDFGTGYSSLSYLRRFPIDILKIDRSFVEGVGSGTEQGALVQTIIALGETLRLRTVAEGIEGAEQLDALRALGCDLGQGYYLAKPLDAAEVSALLLPPTCRDESSSAELAYALPL